jgi:hypothetical protein
LQQLPLGPGKNVAFAGRSAMKTQKMMINFFINDTFYRRRLRPLMPSWSFYIEPPQPLYIFVFAETLADCIPDVGSHRRSIADSLLRSPAAEP